MTSTALQRQAQLAAAQRDSLFATPVKTAPSTNMAQIGCPQHNMGGMPMRVPMHMQPDYGIDMWRVWYIVARIMSELVGCFFIGWAIGVRDIWVSNGAGDPGIIAQAAVRVLVAMGFVFPMMLFKAGHFNPIFTVLAWAHEVNRWGLEPIGIYLGYWLGQFLGFLLGALFVHGGVGGPALLGCTVIRPAFGNGYGFLYEWVGTTALAVVFALAVHRPGANPLGVAGLLAVDFGLVVAIAPATGGSLNLFRSLGVALIEGGNCGNSLGIYVGAMFAAAATAILLLLFIFPAKCLPHGSTYAVHIRQQMIMEEMMMKQKDAQAQPETAEPKQQ